MLKRRLLTEDSKIGDIIAEDTWNDSGIKLIARNSIITPYIKSQLLEMGICEIAVYKAGLVKNNSYITLKENYLESIATIKDILNQLTAGKGLNYDNVLQLADKIYGGIDLSANLINCINELKDIDEYTYTHSINTAFYVMLIAKWLNFREKDIKKAILCGLLHDVGKSLIPTEILNKNGPLTANEYNLIKQHTTYGYELLEAIDELDEEIKLVALQHHERVDGSGYPFKVQANKTEIYSRMVAVADVFDAMTSDRIYKKRVPPFDVFRMFLAEGIGLFDTIILHKFINNIAPFYTGMWVELNNGQVAQIAYIPPHNIINPIICLDNEYIDLDENDNIQIATMLV